MKQLFSLFILAIFATATSFAAEVELKSFKAVSGDADDYISYVAEQGKSATPPAVYSGVIRVYQNGGLFTVNAKNGAKITQIILDHRWQHLSLIAWMELPNRLLRLSRQMRNLL